MTRGRFIVFEGGDGCGKSTQAVRLAERRGALLTREPGGTEIGGAIRAILLDRAHTRLADRAEALLMAADRAQHVAELLAPTLAAGRDVVADRYIGSSVAYQGHGRELGPDVVRELSEWATEGLVPDLVVLLDLDPVISHERLQAGRDRLELADGAFHQRVRAGFLAEAERDPDRWVVIDAAGSIGEISAQVDVAVETRLPGP